MLRADANGLYGELRVSKTRFGDEVLEQINDGSLAGVASVYGIDARTAASRLRRAGREVRPRPTSPASRRH